MQKIYFLLRFWPYAQKNVCCRNVATTRLTKVLNAFFATTTSISLSIDTLLEPNYADQINKDINTTVAAFLIATDLDI